MLDEILTIGYKLIDKFSSSSDILNSTKRFVAIKDCEIKHRIIPDRKTEYHNFLQLNLSSIILLRPLSDEEK